MDEVQLPQGYKESLYFLALKNNCKSNKFLYFIRYDNIEARNYYVSFIIIIVQFSSRYSLMIYMKGRGTFLLHCNYSSRLHESVFTFK